MTGLDSTDSGVALSAGFCFENKSDPLFSTLLSPEGAVVFVLAMKTSGIFCADGVSLVFGFVVETSGAVSVDKWLSLDFSFGVVESGVFSV